MSYLADLVILSRSDGIWMLIVVAIVDERAFIELAQAVARMDPSDKFRVDVEVAHQSGQRPGFLRRIVAVIRRVRPGKGAGKR